MPSDVTRSKHVWGVVKCSIFSAEYPHSRTFSDILYGYSLHLGWFLGIYYKLVLHLHPPFPILEELEFYANFLRLRIFGWKTGLAARTGTLGFIV